MLSFPHAPLSIRPLSAKPITFTFYIIFYIFVAIAGPRQPLNCSKSSEHHVLRIDDLPLIPIAFQDVFRPANSAAHVDYSGNVFTALSAKAFSNTSFDLIITGSL